MTSIFIDADACPVRQEAIRVAERHGVNIYLVSNGGIRPDPSPLVEIVIVPGNFDAADDWIADHAGERDIVVTSDIPLAERCLKAGASVISHGGKPFTRESIGMALAMRALKADLRAMGEIRDGGPSFSKADRSRFLQALENEVQKATRA